MRCIFCNDWCDLAFIKVILQVFLLLCVLGCGYKPMAYYANKALGEKIYVQLVVNLENPEESVRIKDMVNEAIRSRFHSSTTNKNEADSTLEVNIKSVRDTIIGTNAQGIATFYRVFVDIVFQFEHNGKTHRFANPGYYDYAASLSNPTITYNNRSAAILEAARQSTDRFVSQIGYSASF